MSEPIPLEPLATFGPDSPCFGCSPAHPVGLHLTFERHGDEIVTRYTPEERFQGPPGIMHGGLVTTLADELAAWALIGLRERFGFTASLSARLKKPVRIGLEVIGRARIVRDGGRVCTVSLTLSQRDEVAYEGEFTFVLLDQAGAERLLEGPLPEAWKRFARGAS